jgi:hypothetical protein
MDAQTMSKPSLFGIRPQQKVAPPFFVGMADALERLVVDSGEPKFVRMYAWWKLIKVYGTLRFDDHRGLDPASLVLTSATLSGSLTRTKTSGTGKARENLPLSISAFAAISGLDWLRVGLVLWTAHLTPRDYFLLLPAPGLEGVVHAEARYPDAVAMSRAVLARLKCPGEEPLLVDERVAAYWSEHSERATLPSWCGTFPQFPADWISSLGRWGASRGDAYVRTHRRRVSDMQQAVVGVTDQGDFWERFLEETSFQGLSDYLTALGVDPGLVVEQRKRLMSISKISDIAPTEEIQEPSPTEEADQVIE